MTIRYRKCTMAIYLEVFYGTELIAAAAEHGRMAEIIIRGTVSVKENLN